MAKINIPSAVIGGFSHIAALDKEQINKLNGYLKQMPVNGQLEDFENFILTELGLQSPKQIVKTIASFTELLETPNVSQEDLANDLAISYAEGSDTNNENLIESLKRNLFQIFQNSHNLKIIIKARRLVAENNNLLTETKVLTDVRMVFGDNLENTHRHAIVIHKLKIEYRNLGINEMMFFALDLHDLKDLKEQVERAIAKEEVIKKDYKDTLEFINI